MERLIVRVDINYMFDHVIPQFERLITGCISFERLILHRTNDQFKGHINIEIR